MYMCLNVYVCVSKVCFVNSIAYDCVSSGEIACNTNEEPLRSWLKSKTRLTDYMTQLQEPVHRINPVTDPVAYATDSVEKQLPQLPDPVAKPSCQKYPVTDPVARPSCQRYLVNDPVARPSC